MAVETTPGVDSKLMHYIITRFMYTRISFNSQGRIQYVQNINFDTKMD